jgi:hypothetical protein
MTVRDLKKLLEGYDNDLDMKFVIRHPAGLGRRGWVQEELQFDRVSTAPKIDPTVDVTATGQVVQILFFDR